MLRHKIYGPVSLIFYFIAFLYLALIPIGHWQDEYYTFNDIITLNHHFISRIVHWSPRPVSESLIFLYAEIVRVSHRQMISEALAVMWITLIFGLLSPVFRYQKQSGNTLPSSCILFPPALFCLFLTCSPPAEFFYWPVSSFAYMPVLAAASFILGSCLFPVENKKSSQCFIPLILTLSSLCSECGALFTILFCCCHALPNWKEFIRPASPKYNLIWFLPVLSSLLILYALSKGRFGSSGEISNPLIAHHIFRALSAGCTQFFSEIITPYPDGWGQGTGHFYGALLSKILFFWSIYFIFNPENTDRTTHRSCSALFLLGLSCLSCALSIAIASFYEFGMEGSPRHVTLRQCLIYIGLAALAASLAAWRSKKPSLRTSYYPVLLLLGAVVVPFSWNINALVQNYKIYGVLYTIHNNNWQSGLRRSESMIFINTPNAPITGSLQLPPGIYNNGDPSNLWLINGMMGYFHKHTITITNYQQ